MKGEREALGRDLEGGESVTPTYSEALEARADTIREARETFDEMIPRILEDHYGLDRWRTLDEAREQDGDV